MAKQVFKLSDEWIRRKKAQFLKFLKQTDFPDYKRDGSRGPEFYYPEWLIMFISILAVKCKIKEYIQIHRMAVQYWKPIAEGLNLEPISETQLRGRLKKISPASGEPAAFIFQIFPELNEAESRQRG